MPLAAHDNDVGALAAILRGAGAAISVGASVNVSPVGSVAVARGVTVSPLPAVPLACGSAAPSVVTTSSASSFSASGAAEGVAIPATASARGSLRGHCHHRLRDGRGRAPRRCGPGRRRAHSGTGRSHAGARWARTRPKDSCRGRSEDSSSGALWYQLSAGPLIHRTPSTSTPRGRTGGAPPTSDSSSRTARTLSTTADASSAAKMLLGSCAIHDTLSLRKTWSPHLRWRP